MISAKNKWFSIILFVASNFISEISLAEAIKVCQTSQCLRAAENLKESMNFSVDPCENFYQFACGNFGAKNPAKTLFLATSTISNRVDKNTKQIIEFLSKNNSDDEPLAVHKARKLFSSCTDTVTLDKDGIQPLLVMLMRIGLDLNSTDEFDLTYTIVKARKILGNDIFFSVGVMPDPYDRERNRIGITKPSKDFWSLTSTNLINRLQNQYESLTLRKYMQLVVDIVCGNSLTIKCRRLRDSVKSENGSTPLLTSYSNSLESVRGNTYSGNSNLPQRITLKKLQNITNTLAAEMNTSTLNWTKILDLTFENVSTKIDFRASNLKNLTVIVELTYVKDALKFIFSNMKKHEVGLTWKIIDNLAALSGSEIRNLKQNYSWELECQTRDEWCVNTVSQLMGKAVSYFYVADKNFELIKEKIKEEVKYIHQAFRSIIQNTRWMDAITKAKAINKTDSMKLYVSFPSSLKEKKNVDNFYSNFEITDHFLETVAINVQAKINNELKSLNGTNDIHKDRETLTPVMVNAFYDAEQNAIVIPAGIIGFPLCGNGIRSLDYGRIGSIVGHEITHGFDNRGKLYNYVGNIEEWWDDRSLKEFENRAQCYEEAYANYKYMVEGINVTANGAVTLSENIADNGGFKSALKALKDQLSKSNEYLLPQFENYTHEQLFTLGFAQVWCEQNTLVTAFFSSMQDHSPNIIRVNGVLMNSEEFSKIWHCPKGSSMNPTTKCQLW